MSDLRLLVDADACPVKDECVRVALRRGLRVTLVANQGFRLPGPPLVRQVIVGDGFDEADDRIAEAAGPGAVVITSDILLADRVLKAGARALSPRGKPFTPDTIGGAIATRAIMADLRGSGDQAGPGQAPFAKADRSRFLAALDTTLTAASRD